MAASLWVSELVLTYDGVPSYVVSIMELRDGLVIARNDGIAVARRRNGGLAPRTQRSAALRCAAERPGHTSNYLANTVTWN